MGDVTPPTPGEVEEMRQRHGEHAQSAVGKCRWCGVAWPCDAARLLALVGSLRTAILTGETGGIWRAQAERSSARLAAVLAECARWEYVSDDTYWLDRIRRTATGEGVGK